MFAANTQNYSNSQIFKSRTGNPNQNGTPSRNQRANRIFRQISPLKQSTQSPPPQKLQNSQATHYNSRIQSLSPQPQGCTIYYRQGHGLSIPHINSFRSALSPQKLSLIKSSEVLEYQNSLLRKQLQERDDVIIMYKNGWTPNSVPTNDELVKSLNLKLAQKNVLVQQVHRNLIEFQETVAKEKIQISPICQERFKMMMELIMGHEHYPILIRERVIETSKSAQRIYIREDTNINITQQWQIKLEKSYNQLTTLKQKLDWFQKQNQVLEVTITGLKNQRDNPNNDEIANYKLQIQKLTSQTIILQQELTGYKDQISSLTLTMQNLRKSQEPKPDKQKELLIAQRNQLKKKIEEQIIEFSYLKTTIDGLNRTVEVFKKGQSDLIFKINELIEELRIQREKKMVVKDCGHNRQIDDLNTSITTLNIRIRELQDQNRIHLGESKKWRKHLQQAQSYISQLLAELKPFKEGSMKKSQTELEYKRIDEQNKRLSQQISILLVSIEKLKQETRLLKSEQVSLSGALEQYQIKINDYIIQIQTNNRERDIDKARWEGIISSKQRQHMQKIRILQEKLQQSEDENSQLRQQLYRQQKCQSKLKQQEQTKQELRRQIQILQKDQSKMRQNQNIIIDLKRQLQGLQSQLEIFRKYQTTAKQNQAIILSLRKQIDTFKADIAAYKKSDLRVKELENTIAELKRQLEALRSQLSSFESKKQLQISKIRSQYDSKIAQYQSLKSQKQWQLQINTIKQDYEKRIEELWQKLSLAQQHIFKSQQLTRSQISQLQGSIHRLSTQNDTLKKSQAKVQDQYRYKLDNKYAVIQKKLVELSGKNIKSVQSETQYWEKYRMERKKQLQQVQGCINQMLVNLTNVQQTVVVRRDELYRLDLGQLETVLSEINQLKNLKSQSSSSMRQSLQTKFYGILKSVSTKIAQQ